MADDPQQEQPTGVVQPHDHAVASRLLRFGDEVGDGWADVIDLLTLHPELRRQVVRLLAEIDAGSN